MWARFDEDGCAAWFGPEPVAGAEWIEGVDEDTLLTCRRVEGAWLPRPPVTPPEPTPEEIAAARDAEHQAALGARDAAIDAAILASPAYRSFIRGGMTLTAYRDAASDIEAQFPVPVR